jgi:hypothetical protein
MNSMDTDFETLKRAYTWKPIRNCPGRFVLKTGENPSISDLLGEDVLVDVTEHVDTPAPDPVCVYPFDEGGGIISYRKSDGNFVHTLNTPEGFERKLHDLGIR